MSPTAFVVLEQLVRAYPAPVSREMLSQAVWGENRPDSNSLKVHIHHLRKALGKDSGLDVQAATGVGFRLVSGAQ